MKRIFSNDWLRHQIEKEPDNMECGAGFPLESAKGLAQFVGSESGTDKKAAEKATGATFE